MSEKLEEMLAGYVGVGQHSQTPWAVKINVGYPEVVDAKGDFVGSTFNESDKDEANAARIVACVNACEGLSTENLTDNLPIKDLVEKYNAAMKQNSEMLTALRQIATMPAAMHNIEAADKMSEMAWAAIAKAEGA